MMQFRPTPAARLGASQDITANATTSVATAAFGAQTYQIRVATATSGIRVRVGDGTPTATTSDTLLLTSEALYVQVTPGQKLAAIGAAGTVNVTELLP
jgi:hypothetical protein